MNNCVIVGAGNVDEVCFDTFIELVGVDKCYFIAVDGGYEILRKKNIVPALAVGDFDSLGYVPEEVKVVFHPPEKDKTDMLLAIDEAVEAGYKAVYVFGATGGMRLDHTIANMQMLAYAKKAGVQAIILDKAVCTFLIESSMVINTEGITSDGECFITESMCNKLSIGKDYLSLFSYYGFTKGVSVKGCKYEVDKVDLSSKFPLGVSNEIKENNVEISVEEGTLLVVLV